MKGFTLVELLIGLALTGMVVTSLAAAVFGLIWLPGRPQDTLTATRDLEQASLWLSWDGSRAEGFAPTPGYGTFAWVDRSGAAPVSYQASYSFSSGELVREEKQDGVTQSAVSIARNIAQASDVAFNWTAAPSPYLRAAITSSVESAGAQVTALSGEMTASSRARTDTSASAPPTAPGTRIYHVSSGPTLETGTYVSGGTADLYWADSAYYMADSVVVAGDRKVVWWVESEYISDPATIGQIEVSFNGQVSQAAVNLNFYTVDPATGQFSSTPDATYTFSSANTDGYYSYFLSPAKVSYVNGTSRKVMLRVEATRRNVAYRFSADEILFIVSP
jgi:prepilin-type N-terminal cleavage/methylation domain-containing protein